MSHLQILPGGSLGCWDSEAGTQVVTVSGVLREAAAAGLFLALQLLFCCHPLPPCFWPSHALLGGPLGAFSPAAVLFYSS